MYGIFTYIYHQNPTIHVGNYASPMDGLGLFLQFFGTQRYFVSPKSRQFLAHLRLALFP